MAGEGDTTTSGVRFPPPLIFAGMMLIGRAVDGWFGLNPAMPGFVQAVGWGIAALGVVLIGWAIFLFLRAGTNPEPWAPDAAFVATGIYRLTRNPMYLGMALAHLGFALGADSLGMLLTMPVAAGLVDRLVIAREERHLICRFGSSYEEYLRNVRRWL
ncbi:methyltransferase family protein [Croceicoccus mobilis]|uniref:Isoprenylcysteine carboxyl methyltransferase n=1 Tax=Croceicoccus mobilis TaxID=1703339 RepID=A0A916YY89_9SPHN|nr:isoprenylcysteine carboxylmethyltransferase family protein [Croceicoccus mobilis]GGD67593.1 hypothetical protein GCM10010990_16350 [Croceicoccus mobilis]